MAQRNVVDQVLDELSNHPELLLQFWKAIEDAAEYAGAKPLSDEECAAVLGQLSVNILAKQPTWVQRSPGPA